MTPRRRCILKQDCFERWILVHPENERLAWSGLEWVPITVGGCPLYVPVCNFDSKQLAARYAAIFGFSIPSAELPDGGAA